jgi:hypothetical protein
MDSGPTPGRDAFEARTQFIESRNAHGSGDASGFRLQAHGQLSWGRVGLAGTRCCCQCQCWLWAAAGQIQRLHRLHSVTCCVVLQVLVLAAAGTIAMMGATVLAALDGGDASALAQIRDEFATGGGTAPTTWTGPGSCSWLGVTCNTDSTQRVIEIDLSVANAGGTAWTSAGGSTFPFSTLASLQKLVLKDNAKLSGSVPSVSAHPALTFLDVSAICMWVSLGNAT